MTDDELEIVGPDDLDATIVEATVIDKSRVAREAAAAREAEADKLIAETLKRQEAYATTTLESLKAIKTCGHSYFPDRYGRRRCVHCGSQGLSDKQKEFLYVLWRARFHTVDSEAQAFLPSLSIGEASTLIDRLKGIR